MIIRPNAAIGALLFLMFLSFLAIQGQQPPRRVPASAPSDHFSSGRALLYLRAISKEPHPTGTPAAAAVRQYVIQQLKQLGVTPTVQVTKVVRKFPGAPYRAAVVHNIAALLPGTAGRGQKALLLAAHTDSVPHSFGASDDGAGVAALLETLRALRAGAPPKRDVIFLFTDGEELGLLGAKAFVEQHPWARNVGLALNFEARGNGGPSFMFETSEGSEDLIRAFSKAAPHPVASSLMYSLYKKLPNDTDMTFFKKAGFAGLNFAFVQGIQYYHSPNDNLQNLDERSLQHHGSYALSLARYFGNHNLPARSSSNAIYFNLVGFPLVVYSSSWALPLSLMAVLLFAVVIILGFKRKRLSATGILAGMLLFLLALLAAPLLVELAWRLLQLLRPGTTLTTHSGLYACSLLLLAVAVATGIYNRFLAPPLTPGGTPPAPDPPAEPGAMDEGIATPPGPSLVGGSWWGRTRSHLRAKQRPGRRLFTIEEMAVGAISLWLALSLLTSLYLPGASYLFTWPLLFNLLGLALYLSASHSFTRRHSSVTDDQAPNPTPQSKIQKTPPSIGTPEGPIPSHGDSPQHWGAGGAGSRSLDSPQDWGVGGAAPQLSPWLHLLLCASAVPALLIVAPTIYSLFLLLSLALPAALALLFELLLGLLLPLLYSARLIGSHPKPTLLPDVAGPRVTEGKQISFSRACALAALFLAVVGLFLPLHRDGNQRRDTIIHALDADRKEAFWITSDGNLDEWTSQFLPRERENALQHYFPFRQYVPRLFWSRFRTGKAPVLLLAPPQVRLLFDTSPTRTPLRRSSTRTLHLHITSPRRARNIFVFVDSRTPICSAVLDGHKVPGFSVPSSAPVTSPPPADGGFRIGFKIKKSPPPIPPHTFPRSHSHTSTPIPPHTSPPSHPPTYPFSLYYVAPPPEGINLALSTRGPGPIRLLVLDASDGLPTVPGHRYKPRPSYILPTAWSDQTMVARTIAIP